MSSNNSWVRFQRALARNALYGCSWLFEKMPYWFVVGFTHLLLAIAFQLTIRQRRIAEESMDIAFGDELTSQEKKFLIKKCFKNFGMGMTEMLYFMAHPECVDKNVIVEGLQYLDDALKEGKGVIAVTAHYGNFPLMMLAIAKFGYDVSSIIRPARDKELAEYLLKKKKEHGVHAIYAIPRKQCVSNSIKVLRNNGVLFIPIDQNFGSGGGVYVEFFGQRAATATGPVVFARRTEATILPMFIRRKEDGTHLVVIEPPVKIEERSSEDETVQHNMSQITQLIEKYIRKYPHEWAWMHRRWKTQPADKKSATGVS